jgi:hypothetical protein
MATQEQILAAQREETRYIELLREADAIGTRCREWALATNPKRGDWELDLIERAARSAAGDMAARVKAKGYLRSEVSR